MKYRRLGSSGVQVSEISLGSWLTYGGYVQARQAEDTIDKAYECGINFFDTANVYGNGEAEKVVGQALAKYPRSSYVLATKVRGPMGDRPNQAGLSRKHIMEQCEASLKRLGTDYVDVYYCHYPDPDVPLEETLRAMNDLVQQGKALYIGISNMSAQHIREAVRVTNSRDWHPIAANQPLYNLFANEIEKEIIPLCRDNGIGQVVYSPLAQGVLTGKYKTVAPASPESRASQAEGSQAVQHWLKETYVSKASKLQTVAESFGLALSQLALAWTLRHENVSSALIGASRPEQVEENCRASGIRLDSEQWKLVEETCNEPSEV
ncbi:aldo/keto reductase family protein [Cohnella sp. REN36]|uniref:aldo/keto reductase family protein n=1 Tax=Cohnella sp. REN36 TaxID=2887347 RepID=UPI001D13574F|nr:aldo/keto reductase family protein [Cohnella sp. REN36]MCC3375206.1 aldo/keto reductase family protein [Cohnella sp. REN36]